MQVDSQPVISDSDVAEIRNEIERTVDTEFVRDRRARNVAPPPPQFCREEFWRVLLGCLLTTQQRSTKGTPVNRFVDRKPFLLALDSCNNEASIDQFVLDTITRFGGIRRGITISNEAAKNWSRLNSGLWKDAEVWFEKLKQQRSREPRIEDKILERQAARWADEEFAGLGPKQSRNLWQWLGLTRFEIPLDGRVTKWVNQNLTLKIEPKRLNRLSYYESALDHLQAVCDKARVLPCELDAAAFDYEDLGQGNVMNRAQTTKPGFVNTLGQVTIRNTGNPGTDHNQYVYQLGCSRCGAVYGANGSDIHERKCPLVPRRPTRTRTRIRLATSTHGTECRNSLPRHRHRHHAALKLETRPSPLSSLP
jgi:hypothetical protein